ncbi:MAG: AAA family ATPase [Oscillospiraceae bacterium]|nr:AAA family ATPase [Oscillospiraceae bacterium]
MAKIISFANQKGGIGKTTSAINIAASVAKKGHKVLLCDCDPQGNTTSGVGINKKGLHTSTYDLLLGRCDLTSVAVKTTFENLWILPANINLAGAEFELVSLEDRAFRLKNALEAIRSFFDYIFIDCPPSLGVLTLNALAASDGVVIPMQCEYFALEGLTQLMNTIKRTRELYNKNLDITGIVITMYNGKLNLTDQVMSELKKYYADKIFASPVPRGVRLSEAPSYGMPISYYDHNSKGSVAYDEIAAELIERVG